MNRTRILLAAFLSWVDKDEWEMDLSSAYDSDQLKEIKRKFVSIVASARKLSITTEEISEGGIPYFRIAIRMPPRKRGFATVAYKAVGSPR